MLESRKRFRLRAANRFLWRDAKLPTCACHTWCHHLSPPISTHGNSTDTHLRSECKCSSLAKDYIFLLRVILGRFGVECCSKSTRKKYPISIPCTQPKSIGNSTVQKQNLQVAMRIWQEQTLSPTHFTAAEERKSSSRSRTVGQLQVRV